MVLPHYGGPYRSVKIAGALYHQKALPDGVARFQPVEAWDPAEQGA